jgi:L-aspartate oxidase
MSDRPLERVLPHQFDVVIVGAGAAGLYAALCLPKTLKIGLITKTSLSLSASDWAQGGIAAAIAPDDSATLHLEDTLKAGAGLCDWEAVNLLVNQAPECITNLVDLGVEFDRHNHQLALTLEAAHRRHRVLHAADTTGRAIVATLAQAVHTRDNIQVLEQGFVIDLWINPHTQGCQGISLLYQGQLLWLSAQAVLLTTGGAGQVFANTTNPSISTGDGVAMAWRCGALLRDLEFVQFHPTALFQEGAPRFLVSEAVRGEGAHLVNREGRRFAFDDHPNGELAPRDVVSRSIYRYLQRHRREDEPPCVWLDLRPIAPEVIQRRFPNIMQVCRSWGVDVFHEPIPVAPAAHYWMGGIATDTMNQTSIAGLYALGETASTGVHGANRLASNSLLECLVFGRQLSRLELAHSSDPWQETSSQEQNPQWEQWQRAIAPYETESAILEQLLSYQDQLQQLMWDSAGICRHPEMLNRAIAQVAVWQQELQNLPLSHALQGFYGTQANAHIDTQVGDRLSHIIPIWGETRNLIDVALLILRSADFRTESRGGHYREDFPDTNPDWQAHTLVQGDRFFRSDPISNGITGSSD